MFITQKALKKVPKQKEIRVRKALGYFSFIWKKSPVFLEKREKQL